MDFGAMMMNATGTPIALPQQSVASTPGDLSQMDIQDASDPTGYIPDLSLIFNDASPGMDYRPIQDGHFPYVGGLTSTQLLVQNLYKIVERLNNDWLQILYSTPHLVSRRSPLASFDVFSRGIRAMQQCFKDSVSDRSEPTLPNPLQGRYEDLFSDVVMDSFENILSTVHVAHACAYLINENEDYDWNGLFIHMLQWGYLLSNQDDVQCFLIAMHQLRCEHTYHFTIPLSGDGIFYQQSHTGTLDMLKVGPALKGFSMFVDGRHSLDLTWYIFLTSKRVAFEYSRLYERNIVLLTEPLNWHTPNRATQDMAGGIITPLREDPRLEGFHKIVDDVEVLLHADVLRNPREVEVMLIIHGRVSVAART